MSKLKFENMPNFFSIFFAAKNHNFTYELNKLKLECFEFRDFDQANS